MIFIKVLVLTILCECTYGWVAMYQLEENPAYPGKCYFPTGTSGIPKYLTPLVIDGGKKYILPAGHCFKIDCESDGLSAAFTGCGLVSAQPPCRIKKSPKNSQFPECCSTVECPGYT